MLTQRAVYLDCNATHPLLPSVRAELSRALETQSSELLNPSSIHQHGQKAKAVMSKLRQKLGQMVGRNDEDEWVFTSGATESINTILKGFVKASRADGLDPVIITSATEHSAVLETAENSEARVHVISVDQMGNLNRDGFFETLKNEVAKKNTQILLSFILANNETGVLLDLSMIREALALGDSKFFGAQGSSAFSKKDQRLFLHLDAAQAIGKVDDRFVRMAWHLADYASVTAHKMGAPSGIGAMWLRPKTPYEKFFHGGVQEKKRRAGTFNSLAGYAWLVALEDWIKNGHFYREKMISLRAFAVEKLSNIEGLHFHGFDPREKFCGEKNSTNTINFHIEGCDEESLVLALDLEGFSVSSGSACNSGTLKPSRVIASMGYSSKVALSSVRVSMGVETKKEELEAFIKALNTIVSRIQDGKKKWSAVLPPVLDGAEL